MADLIAGNTYEHYDEHAGWIRDALYSRYGQTARLS